MENEPKPGQGGQPQPTQPKPGQDQGAPNEKPGSNEKPGQSGYGR